MDSIMIIHSIRPSQGHHYSYGTYHSRVTRYAGGEGKAEYRRHEVRPIRRRSAGDHISSKNLLKVRSRLPIIGVKCERSPFFSWRMRRCFEAKAIVVVQAHQLTAVRIGNLNIITYYQEVLIIVMGSCPAEVM